MNRLLELYDIMTGDYYLRQKLNFAKFMFSQKKEFLKYHPVTISIVATTRCTLACDMCPTHSKIVPEDYPYLQKNTKDITFDMFKEIMERFKNAIAVHIIGAGEPLLNRDFFKMVDYAADKKMTVKTISNGTTIKNNIDKFIQSKLEGITISINGHNAKEFKRMTGMDERYYHEIYMATDTLVKEKRRGTSKIRVKLSFIVDRYNYAFIPDMIDIGLKLGVDHMFFCNFLPAPYDGLSVNERALPAESKFINEIESLFKRYPPQIRRKITPPVLLDRKTNRNKCGTHFSQIRFDGDGNISSCSMMLLNMCGHGNYRDDNVWNNEFFKTMRKRFLSEGDTSLFDACKKCPENRGVSIQ